MMDIINFFKNKSILVTGGTGSFGRLFVKNLLEEDACSKVIVFSRDEYKQNEMRQAEPIFNSKKAHYLLGDVRDPQRLRSAFSGIDIVVHTAALKQVPAAETNPSEFIKTNILGTMNVIDASIEMGVEQVLVLSSDKAVNPINLYGATKLCTEKLVIAANEGLQRPQMTKLSVVRYGNVLDSRGSIIPLWKNLVAQNATSLPVTDRRMTRFFMSLQDAVAFVKSMLTRMEGQEIFVRKCPSMKITDLAHAFAPNLPITVCGIRPGEKLHEVLINSDEASHTYEYPHYYVIVPETWKHSPEKLEHFLKQYPGRLLAPGFTYTSDHNDQWLTSEQIRWDGQRPKEHATIN